MDVDQIVGAGKDDGSVSIECVAAAGNVGVEVADGGDRGYSYFTVETAAGERWSGSQTGKWTLRFLIIFK